MSIIYSTGTIVYTSFTCASGTRREIVDGLAVALASGDWSYISGEGTGDVLMECAETGSGHSIRLRIYDPGSTNYARAQLKNAAGTLTSQDFYISIGVGRTFYVIVHPSTFYLFTTNTAGEGHTLLGGSLYAEQNFLSTVLPPGDLGWLQGSSYSSTVQDTFRQLLSASDGVWSTIANDVLVNETYSSAYGMMMLVVRMAFNHIEGSALQYHDGSYVHYEPELAWGPTGYNSEAVIFGQIPDAFMSTQGYNGTETETFDGHDWFAFTNNPTGRTATWRGTLFLRVT